MPTDGYADPAGCTRDGTVPIPHFYVVLHQSRDLLSVRLAWRYQSVTDTIDEQLYVILWCGVGETKCPAMFPLALFLIWVYYVFITGGEDNAAQNHKGDQPHKPSHVLPSPTPRRQGKALCP